MSITTLSAPCPPPVTDKGSSVIRPASSSTGPRSPVSGPRLDGHRPPCSNSTGPKTPEGKARSSQNARKHGLSAMHLVVREDERDEFTELECSLLDDVRPETALETETFRHLVHAAWNLRRLERLEAELFDSGTDPLSDPDLAPTLDRYARYHQRHQRAYYRALKELKSLQTNRALQQAAEDRGELAPDAPPLADNMKLTKRTVPLDVWQTFQRLLDREGGQRAMLAAMEFVKEKFAGSCADFQSFEEELRAGSQKYVR
jgi:hypothetical protein